ncbi:MAG: phage tail tape measure protein [Acidimicrobiia bacterium]|nr:MAG: phage tail tape measure protein [Acidimicrobiia bacterium]
MADANKMVSILLRLVDRLSGPARTAEKALGGVDKAAKRAASNGSAAGRFARGAGAGMEGLGKSAFKGAADFNAAADQIQSTSRGLLNAVKTPLQVTADLEASQSKVKALTFKGQGGPEVEAQMARLEATAIRMGSTTQFSALDSSQAMEILAMAGYDANQQMAALPGLLNTAAAGGVDIARSADVTAGAIAAFKLQAEDATRVGDVLAMTFTSTKTSIDTIAESLKYVAPTAQAAGVSLEETAAAIGALGQSSIDSSQAGTALNNLLLRLQAPDKIGKKVFAALGVKTTDEKGNIKPLSTILADLERGMDRKFGKGKGGAKRAAVMKTIFGQEGQAAAGVLMGSATSGELDRLIKANQEAAGTSERVAKVMQEGAKGAAKEMESAIEGLYITMGRQLIPAVTELTKKMTELVGRITEVTGAHPDATKGALGTAAALGVIGVVAAPVMKGIMVVVGAVKGLAKVFVIARTAALLFASSALATKAWALAAGGIAMVSKAFAALSAVIMANPIVAIVTGIALAATLIYVYWDELGDFFRGLMDTIVGYVDGALEAITGKVDVMKGAIASITGGPGEGVNATMKLVRQTQIEAEAKAAGQGEPAAAGGGVDGALAGGPAGINAMFADMQRQMEATINIQVDQEGRVSGVKTNAPKGVRMPANLGMQGV